MGLDVREYAFGVKSLRTNTVPDPMSVYRFVAANAWLVTRIRYWNGALEAGWLEVAGEKIDVEISGCVCLEPNGAYRGDVRVFGAGGVVIVEYWWQATADGEPPVIGVTV